MTKSIFKFTLVLFVLGAMQFIDFSHYSIPLAYAAVDCNAAGIICKSGVLTGNETWTAGNVYMVTGDVTVPNGATLTIQAGTIVKFQTDDSLFVSGKLVASGTLAELIYFTSYRDDSVGGDTNNDGFSAAAVEDWGRIVFNDNSDDTSIIQHVTIRYSGNDGYSSNDYGPIQLINASPTLKNITFESNYINGVEIPGGNWQTDSWDNTDVVYYVRKDLTIPAGNTLTISPGVVVKFTPDTSLLVDGKLVASGTNSNNIIFTSYRDDSAGGDTNTGGFSAGLVEDWGRIRFSDNSDDSSIIQYVTIRYSGNDGYSSNDYGPIQLINASPILEDIIFESNYINGVEIPGGNWQTDTWDNTDVVYYVRKDLTIPIGNTLTISPGIIVKFTPDTSLFVDGKLVVSGTNSNNIIFTSYRDDRAGGDTNTGGFSAGLVEDWGRIRFNDQSDDTSIIQYMTIRYSGNDGYSSNDYGAIELANASPSLNNITFTSNYINGVEVSATPLATDSWDNPDVVYYVRKDLTISAGNILTISPGVIVKLASDTSLFVEGGLRATGTLSNNVILTSYRDDSVGGDTNNNGFSAGAVEDWGRIQFKDGSDDTSIIQHTTIRYSGNDGYSSNDFGAIQLLHASPSISHTTLTNNYSGVEALNGSIPKMTCNRIYDNTHLGIDNDTSANIIKAENHWWGDASGPTHTGNPGGTGQAVSDGVDYSPWAADTGCSTPATQLQATPAGLSFQTTPGQNPADPIDQPE